jgi:transposase-like protein
MLKCPECGSAEYDHVASWGGDGEPIQEHFVCYDCDTQFTATYNLVKVEKGCGDCGEPVSCEYDD